MNLIEQCNALLQEGVDNQDFPGAHYAIIRGSGTVLFGHVGFKQTDPHRIPLSGNEIYDVASLTKVISTTTLIMRLIDLNQLSLATTVSTILPKFQHTNITIEHLLTHCSGLPADIPKANTLASKTDVEEYIFQVGLAYETETKIIYSDIGFILLGWIVEAVTEQPLSVVAKQWIFEPLGMSDSSYHPPHERCAPTELREDNIYNGYLQGRVHDEKAFALGGCAGHAGLFSTTKDIATFIRMYLTSDDTILSTQMMDAMFVPRRFGSTPSGYPVIRAYGFDKPTKGGTAGDYIDYDQTIIHTGFTGCNLWIDRTNQLGFVMLSNAVHPKRNRNGIIPYRRKMANLILSYYQEATNEKTT